MAIDFPAGTNVGQTFEANNVTYTWDGDKWTAGSSKTSEALFVNKSGDSMTGALVLPGDPQSDYQAATKKYVDENGGGGGGGGGGTTKADIYGTAKASLRINTSEVTGTEAAPSMAGVYESRGIVGVGKKAVGRYFIDFETDLFKDINYIINGTASRTNLQTGITVFEETIAGSGSPRTTTRVYIATVNATAYLDAEYINFTAFDNEPAEIVVGSGTVANTNIYGTAKAWANVAADGTLIEGTNCTTAAGASTGEYAVTFLRPFNTDSYSVNVSCEGQFVVILGTTTTGFTYKTLNNTGVGIAAQTFFQVVDNEPAEVALTTFGDVINYSGASAWCELDPDNNLLGGINIASVVSTATGEREITFQTPMPNANYSVLTNISEKFNNASSQFQSVSYDHTPTGFTLRTKGNTSYKDYGVSIVVFATNALPPKGGTGTDSWATVDETTVNGACNVPASFNVDSVTRTAAGVYDVVFTTPMPTANYVAAPSIVWTGAGNSPSCATKDLTTTGFTIVIYSTGYIDLQFSFTVNATNAQLPDTFTIEQFNDLVARVQALESA